MDRKMTFSAALLAALLAASLAAAPARAMDGCAIKVDQEAPDFTLKGMDGKTYTLSDYRGKKVVILEFWATWCGVCKDEIPTLIKEDYLPLKDKGLEILAITLHTGEAFEVQEVMDKYKIPWPVLLDENLTVATKLYRLAGPIPLKVIVDGKGIVRYQHIGDYAPGENEIPDVVKDLIAETLPASAAAGPAAAPASTAKAVPAKPAK